MTRPSLLTLLAREWQALRRDPWLFSLVSWLPPLLFLVMWAIMSAGLARDLPVGVVDLDKSAMSRALIRHYDAASALAVDPSFAEPQQGAAALRTGKIYALIIIPADLEKAALLGSTPQVSGFVNSQFLLIARVINSALLQAHGSFAARVEIGKNLAAGPPVMDRAFATALPITTQVTPLFNSSTNYAQFLVAAILPAIWQIVMVAGTVLSLAAEQRRQGVARWLGAFPLPALFAKFLVLATLFWGHGLLFLGLMYGVLGWPMHGSWTLLLLAQLLTVCASLAAASVFFFLTRDGARAMSLAAAYAAPGLAYMGVTFPVSDMNLAARIWRSFLPINPYIEIQFAQVNAGAALISALPQLTNLALFLVIVPFIVDKAKQLAETPARHMRKI